MDGRMNEQANKCEQYQKHNNTGYFFSLKKKSGNEAKMKPKKKKILVIRSFEPQKRLYLLSVFFLKLYSTLTTFFPPSKETFNGQIKQSLFFFLLKN